MIPQIDDFITIMEQYIFNIRIIIIIIGNKKINSIFDTESKIIHFMVSNKFINKVLASFQTRPPSSP